MPLEISNNLKTQKNKLEQKDPWVYLCEIELPAGWYRITNHVHDIEWPTGSETIWYAHPLAVSSVKYSSKGEVQTATVSIANLGDILTDYLVNNIGLTRKQGNLYLVNFLYLDDPVYSVIPERFVVATTSNQNGIATFNLTLGVDAYGIEGPIGNYTRLEFPSMPIVSLRYSLGAI
jgi:hypothetical protein